MKIYRKVNGVLVGSKAKGFKLILAYFCLVLFFVFLGVCVVLAAALPSVGLLLFCAIAAFGPKVRDEKDKNNSVVVYNDKGCRFKVVG